MAQGSKLFLFYAFFDFLVIIGLLLRLIGYGAAANDVQSIFLKLLYQLKKDQVQLQNMTCQDMICMDKDQSKPLKERLLILTPINKEGWYRCKKTNRHFENLDEFEEMNEELSERLQNYENSVQNGIDLQTYKIEFDLLELFGIPIDYSMVYEVSMTVLALLISII